MSSPPDALPALHGDRACAQAHDRLGARIAPDGQARCFYRSGGLRRISQGRTRPAQPGGASAKPAAQGLAAVAFDWVLPRCLHPASFHDSVTISFFLNQGADRGDTETALVSLGIIFLYGARLRLTAALGPLPSCIGGESVVNRPSAPSFRLCAESVGAFEITLPSGLLTKLNAASNRRRGRYLIDGIDLSLTAFAVSVFCGTLLAASVQGGSSSRARHASFGSGLALPFFFLALFPGYLQRLPRGAWMARVKLMVSGLARCLLPEPGWTWFGAGTAHKRAFGVWVLLALPGLYLLGRWRDLADAPVTRAARCGHALSGFAIGLIQDARARWRVGAVPARRFRGYRSALRAAGHECEMDQR